TPGVQVPSHRGPPALPRAGRGRARAAARLPSPRGGRRGPARTGRGQQRGGMSLADRRETGREVLARQQLDEGKVFDLVGEDVRLSAEDAEPVLREFLDHPGAVAVVALRQGPAGEELALVDQYRHPVRAVLWEIPAGLLDVT